MSKVEQALREARFLAVATLAFHGRDRGTDRQEKMLDDLEELARAVDTLTMDAITSLEQIDAGGKA